MKTGAFFFLLTLSILLIPRVIVYSRMPMEASKLTYKQHFKQMLVTSYSDNGKMADGKNAHIGAVACPRNWSLGKKLYISKKYYTCEDRYNKRLSDRLDVWMKSYKEAKNFGAQKIMVEILPTQALAEKL